MSTGTATDTAPKTEAPKKKSNWGCGLAGILAILALGAIAVCGGGAMWAWDSSSDPDPVVADAGPSCSPPTGVELTSFAPDGALLWTEDAIGPMGTMTVILCDGPTYRAIRVTGFEPGEDGNWQEGAMVDGARRVVYWSDLFDITSTRPVKVKRLDGIVAQCLPELGSCQRNAGT